MSNWTSRRQGLELRSWNRICAVGLWVKTRQSNEPPLRTMHRCFSDLGRRLFPFVPKTVQLWRTAHLKSFRRRPPPAFFHLGASQNCRLLRRSLTPSFLALRCRSGYPIRSGRRPSSARPSRQRTFGRLPVRFRVLFSPAAG